jgi:hypothetical protein
VLTLKPLVDEEVTIDNEDFAIVLTLKPLVDEEVTIDNLSDLYRDAIMDLIAYLVVVTFTFLHRT